ncbi:MAG: peptidoglycan-associated lipoprotein Pal [Alphaproteobacteria bacterium]|nr:peptidoglycan-associated lipoprotein Pal [Alphaproteobacteria bacterium]
MRLNSFGSKFLGVAAAALLLAACESTPETTGTAAGAGGQGAAPATTATAPTTTAPAVTPGTKADFELNVGDRVFFDFDKFDLKPAARATLERQAAWLRQYPQKTVVVEGHCDERGTREYNLALGERRANAAKRFLMSQGVAEARIRTISYGKERPAALGSNEAAWSQNRRSVTVVAN